MKIITTFLQQETHLGLAQPSKLGDGWCHERGGNRCGHFPAVPRLYKVPTHYKLPPSVLQYSIHRLKLFYDRPSRWLKKLSLARCSTRQERSEAREADCAVAGVLLQYLDLATLRFGMWHGDGSFKSFDVRYIAKKAGWRAEEDEKDDKQALLEGKRPGGKGTKRAQRALGRLKRAGYLSSHNRSKTIKGKEGKAKHIGLAAVRCLSPQFFYDLGISREELKKKRDEAAKRLNKRLKKHAEEQLSQERAAYFKLAEKLKLKHSMQAGRALPAAEHLNQGLEEKTTGGARGHLSLIKAMLAAPLRERPG